MVLKEQQKIIDVIDKRLDWLREKSKFYFKNKEYRDWRQRVLVLDYSIQELEDIKIKIVEALDNI